MPLATIEVRGKSSRWVVNWHAPQEQIDAMREDGIEVGIVQYIIPAWVVDLGYGPTRVWCFFSDVWNLKNPFWEKPE
ncbi:MAG TPA: hypothetical protein VFU31_11385 [Candidatus Binatia bacterium]|nr:hypothetical protein [Candidatus Binatia bacterium]